MNKYYIRKGDANPKMEARLTDVDGNSVVNAGDNVELLIEIGETTVSRPVTIVNKNLGKVEALMSADMFPEEGIYKAYFRNNSQFLTIPNYTFIEIVVAREF